MRWRAQRRAYRDLLRQRRESFWVDSERSRPSQLWAVVNDNVSGLVLNILAVARHLVDFNGAGKITKAEAGTMSAPLKLRPYGAIQICLLLLFFRW